MAAYTAIDDPEAYFQVELYTGTGSALTATFDGDTDMQPDLIWIKERSASDSAHNLTDSVRGAGKAVFPSSTQVEYDYGTGSDGTVLTFASDGFTLGTATQVNANTVTFVAWCWKESATAGFDIVAYTGTGNDATATISHSLSAVPDFIWIKCRTSSKNNITYHGSLGNTYSQYLDETNASSTSYDYWADTSPTSSVFTVKDDGSYDEVNAANDQTFIAYLWSGKQGFSKFGSYTGNGADSGPFVFLGFRPAFLILKRADSADAWTIFDNKRDTDNPVLQKLEAHASTAEAAGDPGHDFLSNGFNLRETGGHVNTSGGTYVYMAFAEAPFVNSNGVPCNAR